MSDKIYLVTQDGALSPMEEHRYDSEDLLQGLLETYPDLLAGDQMDRESPRRWRLISREIGIPDQEGGGDRWALDHLFLDQDGVPTLVEVKRRVLPVRRCRRRDTSEAWRTRLRRCEGRFEDGYPVSPHG